MRKIIALTVLSFGLGAAFAAPPMHHHPNPKCPACHMELATSKSRANPIAVRLHKGGHIYYCCAGCVAKMPKGILVHPKHNR